MKIPMTLFRCGRRECRAMLAIADTALYCFAKKV